MSAIKNPKTLIRNIAKKLGQLHKVIQLFKSQIADREYQIEILHQRYDPQINENLHRYQVSMEAKLMEIDEKQKDMTEKTEKLYNRKYEMLMEEAKNYVDAATASLEQFQEKIMGDIEEIAKMVRAIMNQLDTKRMAMDEVVAQAKKKVEEEMKKISETFKQEARSHDDESKKKQDALVAESQRTIAEMKEKHALEMKSLRGTTSSAPDPKILEKLRGLKQQLAHLKTMLSGNRDNVMELMKTRQQQAKERSEKMANVTGSLRKLIDDHAENLGKMMAEYDAEVASNEKELEQLTHDIEAEDVRHEQEIKDKKAGHEEEVEKMKAELEETSARCQTNFSSLDEAMKALEARHELELEKIRSQHEQAAKDWEVKLAQRHRDLMVVQDEQVRDKKKVEDELARAKSKHEVDIKSLSQIHGNEMQFETDEFNKKAKEIQDQIDGVLEGGSEEAKKSSTRLQKLREEKERILKEYAEMTAKYDEDHAKRTEDLANGNAQKLATSKASNQTSLEAQQKKDEDEYEALKKKLDSEYEELQGKADGSYSSEMSGLEKLRSNRSDIDKITAEFQNSFDKEQVELNGVIAPDIDNSELFQKFDMGIKELGKQRTEVINLIEMQKKALKGEWDAKIDAENERHGRQVVRSSLGTSRERNRLALLQEINDIKQTRADEEQQRKGELERIKSEFDRAVTELEAELVVANSTEEIERLESEIAQLKRERIDNKEGAEEARAKREADLNDKLAAEKERFVQEEKDLEVRIEEEDAKTRETKRDLEQKIVSSQKVSEAECEETRLKTISTLDQLASSQIQRVESIARDCQTMKSNLERSSLAFQKKLKDTRAQNQSATDEYVRIARADAEKRAKDWEEMRSFYEEKLEVLTKKRDDAIEIFERRPPRQSEIDIIDRLENLLQTKTSQLQTSIKEFQEYRTLLVQQEREYNHRFGKGPKVGVLAVAKGPH